MRTITDPASTGEPSLAAHRTPDIRLTNAGLSPEALFARADAFADAATVATTHVERLRLEAAADDAWIAAANALAPEQTAAAVCAAAMSGPCDR